MLNQLHSCFKKISFKQFVKIYLIAFVVNYVLSYAALYLNNHLARIPSYMFFIITMYGVILYVYIKTFRDIEKKKQKAYDLFKFLTGAHFFFMAYSVYTLLLAYSNNYSQEYQYIYLFILSYLLNISLYLSSFLYIQYYWKRHN
jgi:hypothetical protein